MAVSRFDAILVVLLALAGQIADVLLQQTGIRNQINFMLAGFDPFSLVSGSVLVVACFLKIHDLRAGFRDFALVLFDKGLYFIVKKAAFQFVRCLPSVKNQIESGTEEAVKKIHHELRKDVQSESSNLLLPKAGVDKDVLFSRLSKWSEFEHGKWGSGKVSGAVYHGGDDLTEFACDVYSRFALSNPLHPDLFPFVRKMEAEIVAMTINLFHGDPNSCCGSISSGGTESILLACKAYRDRAFSNGITNPELIAPVSIHAAFEKAAQYFGIKLIHTPLDPVTMAASVSAIRSLITSNTILIAASAPCFPYGIIDPIEDIAKLALGHGIGFHVDCCLGSYLIPFLAEIDNPVPLFDFSVHGVTSISCDLHKYGFAPKGISCIMYRSPELRRFQYFSSVGWTGGIYASPTLAGSRPGALSAAAWATMMVLGQDGYKACAFHIMDATKVIIDGVRQIKELRILGEPKISVVAFAAADPTSINIYNVNEAMTKKGEIAKRFVSDVKISVNEVIANPNAFSDGAAAIYGMAASLPDVSVLDEVARAYIDGLFMS